MEASGIEGLELIKTDRDAWSAILRALMETKGNEPFLTPVDWKAWGLTDYLQIVKTPMDLGTIGTKLKKGGYATFSDFNDDVRLVIDNCKVYNQRTSDIHKAALRLDRQYEREVNKAVRKAGGVGKTRGITSEDRDKFCKYLFQLKAAEVGRVVEIVDELCPSALDKTAKDEVDLNVDSIPGDAYRKIEAYVLEALGKASSSTVHSETSGGATVASSSTASGPPPPPPPPSSSSAKSKKRTRPSEGGGDE